jgi:hypothetical protein
VKLTQATAVAIATAVSQVRPDWDHPGILAALRIEADRGTPDVDVFVAIANLARNREARTPGLLNKPGRHWSTQDGPTVRRGDLDVACPDHPEHSHPCPTCKAERETSAALASTGAASVRAALADAPRYATPEQRRTNSRNQEDQ